MALATISSFSSLASGMLIAARIWATVMASLISDHLAVHRGLVEDPDLQDMPAGAVEVSIVFKARVVAETVTAGAVPSRVSSRAQ